nr:hypothetical protein LKV13_04855 [Borrelia sp. BU AG58]
MKRYSLEEDNGNKSVFDNIDKDFFPSHTTPLGSRSAVNFGSGCALKEIRSLLPGIDESLLLLGIDESLFKQDIISSFCGSLNALDLDPELETQSYDDLESGSGYDLPSSASGLQGRWDDKKATFDSLGDSLASSLIRLINLIPVVSRLDFDLKGLPNKPDAFNLDLSREQSKCKFNAGFPTFSVTDQDNFDIESEAYKTFKKFNWNEQVNDFDIIHERLNMNLEQSRGNNLAGIEDVTYGAFENKRIEDMLANTGRFETQVDMNDFILKTCGFKSLLPRVASSGSNDNTLLDVVRLASCLKSGKYMQDNNEAVSVVYDLFKGDDSRLTSIINKTDHIKGNSCDLNASTNINFANNACLDLKNKLNGALESFDSIDSGQILNPDIESIAGFKDDIQLLTDQVRELLSCFSALDFTKNIVEPLSDAFFNMENAINTLADSFKFGLQGNCYRSNMHDYNMGNQSSRMPW